MRKNCNDLLEAIHAAENPLDIEDVIFNADSLQKARRLFYEVNVMGKTPVKGQFEAIDSNSGVYITVYRTDWDYECPETFYNNEDFVKFVNDEIADRVYFYQHEFNYTAEEAEENIYGYSLCTKYF